MRKTFALLLATAFVAALPSLASAKSKRHQAPVAMQSVDSNEAGPRLVGNALYQLIVPLQVTFARQPEPEPVTHHRKRHRSTRS